MLGKDLSHDARALATKADKLWVNHSHQLSRSIAFRNSVLAAKKRQEDLPSPILAAYTLEIVATAWADPLKWPSPGTAQVFAFSTGDSVTRRTTAYRSAPGRELVVGGCLSAIAPSTLVHILDSVAGWWFSGG